MENNICKKGLVLGIIFLFVGTSFISIVVPIPAARSAEVLNWPLVWETDLIPFLPPVTIGTYTWFDYSICMPVLCDVTGDGIQEVFITKGYSDTTGHGADGLYNDGSVWCLNGATGAIIWHYAAWNIGNHAVMSIHDLDGDGDKELLVCGYHNTTAFHAQNGQILWNEMDGVDTDKYCHDKPAVVLKLGGVIYVYTCKNTNGLAGGVVKRLGSTGQIVAQSPAGVYHPCYGGLSSADINGDGQLEILLGDRSTGVGLACYKASDLSLIWNYASVACSTQTPMIMDLNGDAYLDVLICNQASHTLCAVNGQTGGQLFWNVCSGIPSSDGDTYTSATYDIDKDGHLEYLTAINSNIKVYDLSTLTLDADIANPHGWPKYDASPIVANVYGNSDMEFINQFSYDGIDVFDSTYTCVANNPLIHSNTRSIALSMTVVDMDNDGYNEVIQLCHKDGTGSGTYATVQVLRTGGQVSSPKATAKDQWYTCKRNVLSQYVQYDDPDSNNPPLNIIEVNAPDTGYVGESIQFNATVEPLSGQPPYSYHWDFGDQGTSTTLNPTHVYTKAGHYTYTFTVTDSAGATASKSGNITIQNKYELKRAFIFGRYTNLTEENEYIVIEAVNLRLIFFNPLQILHYTDGEKITFVKDTAKVIIFPQFIIGFIDVVT
jgi:chitodextrinase